MSSPALRLKGIAAALALAILAAATATTAPATSEPAPSGPGEHAGMASTAVRPEAGTTAHAARTITLDETGHLLETSRHNFTLNERGSASGTAAGAIYVHLTTVSSSRVTAEVNIYPHGGSLSGYGTGYYRRGSTSISFSGSMSIQRGTGSYAGVHGSGLSFSGVIQESSHDPITVHVSGRVSS